MTQTISLFVLKNKTILAVLTAVLFATTVIAPSAFAETSSTDDRLGLDRSDFRENIDLGQAPLEETISKLINTFIGLLGIVAVIIILIGGFQWMTAGGDDEKIGGAKKMIYAGVAGLAVILAAYAIAAFVIDELIGATGYGEPVDSTGAVY